MKAETRNLIGGRLVESESRATFPNLNPAQVIGLPVQR